jgi:anaerobic ribonucleoside-triphosphate reductase
MPEDEKMLLIRIAADMTKYYTFLSQALRTVYDVEVASQMPQEVLLSLLNKTRDGLLLVLNENTVVKEGMEQIYHEVIRILTRANTGDALAAEEAKELGKKLTERIKAMSDLVAIYRRL